VTRIISGTARGLRLETPRGDRTRPTSDRVREALFSAIESWAGSLHGLRVLDLYAGSGAVGLEAWSRGADAVTFVESDRRTADLIRRNARALTGARVIVERGSRSPEPAWPAGIRPLSGKRRMKKYGETKLWYAAAGEEQVPEPLR
jgi:16S rRNA (guanine966-N2)-methyltransferase